jgi:hypothetical protein
VTGVVVIVGTVVDMSVQEEVKIFGRCGWVMSQYVMKHGLILSPFRHPSIFCFPHCARPGTSASSELYMLESRAHAVVYIRTSTTSTSYSYIAKIYGVYKMPPLGGKNQL